MKPVVLIAANFLREHRWPVLSLFAWIVLLALASADFGKDRAVADDVVFYLAQQGIFICVFSAFLAADAVHNDRRSKRILLVLSKAVSRPRYLLAPILGTFAAAVAYAVVYGLSGTWLAARAEQPAAAMGTLMMLVIAGSVLAASVAMFFSTFLNPYVAVAATVALFAGPGALHLQRHDWSLWLPGFPILFKFVAFRFSADWNVSWMLFVLSFAQAVLFWVLAATVFSRRDIAVPVE